MFPFVAADSNRFTNTKINDSQYFLQDMGGVNQGFDGNIGFSNQNFQCQFPSIPTPLIDSVGFIGSGPSNGEQNRVNQDDWNLSNYEGVFMNNHISHYTDLPPPPLGEKVDLPYSNSWVPQPEALPTTIPYVSRSNGGPLHPQPQYPGFYQLGDWQQLPYLPSTEQPEALTHWNQSHFTECQNSNCDICGTLSLLRSKRKYDLSGTSCDSALPLKRPRMNIPSTNQNAPLVCFEDLWVDNKASVFDDTDIKLYTEILNSKEDPTSSGVTKVDVIEQPQSWDFSPTYFSEECMSGVVGISSDDSYNSFPVSIHKEGEIDFIYNPSVLELNSASIFPSINFVQQEKEHSTTSHGVNYNIEQEIDAAENKSPLLISTNTSSFSNQREVDHSSESEINIETNSWKKEERNSEIKVKGVSLTDFFTVEQMKEHLDSLLQTSICQEGKGKNTHTDTENTCQLCEMTTLELAPALVYCSVCSLRIKSNMIYYWTLDEKSKLKYKFCGKCFRGNYGANISFNGISISKSELVKEKGIDKTDEPWVQCDKCKLWQHQICALFNKNRDNADEKYICPRCCLEEMEQGKRVPLPKSVGFSAKDLPRTLLSDHIEHRLFTRLNQERKQRAKDLGKKPDEVPGAEGLVVRVVSSSQKQLKVNQQFLDIFNDKNYPSEHKYNSKVILLFQEIDGVDVCIFGMFVQEFGSECAPPNKRCVYISYIDSVKYFRPEMQTVKGEALRTFIYHEILIGYLEFCKKQGFITCYIWACPPPKGEDYILYCHPDTQKTPKADKLRSWYQTMLRKATKDNVVVDYTNIYDHFFVPRGDNRKITAARLPYFDGDYWSTAAQEILAKTERENRLGHEKPEKKVSMRVLKSMGHTDINESAKDVLVMQELASRILPNKEDFIVVRLHFTCTRCSEEILPGSHWFCEQCKDLHFCSKCVELNLDFKKKKTHISAGNEKHILLKAVVDEVPSNTEAEDILFKNDIFENRDAFLSFCNKNNCQFDSLRRAKYSSMMILYEIEKIAALTFGRNSRDLT